MGGKDAKNRRKLQRQHLQQQQDAAGGDPSSSSVGYSGNSKSMQKEFNRQNHNHEKFSGNGGGFHKGKHSHAKFVANTGSKPRRAPKEYENDSRAGKPRREPNNSNNTPPPNKKKKFQKPKHLKRKLETADDDNVKEKLLEELQTFQKIKEKTTTPKSNKKLKKSHGDGIGHAAMEILPAPTDFPRSTLSTPTTEAAVDSKATNQAITGIPKFGEGKTIRQKKTEQAVEAKAATKKIADTPSLKNDKSKKQQKKETTKSQQKNEKVDESTSSSSDNDGSDSDEEVVPEKAEANKKKPETADTPKTKKVKSKEQETKEKDNDSSSSSDSDSEGSDSDSDNDEEQTAQRTRGRGRKGRKDTSEKVQEQTKDQAKDDKEKQDRKSKNGERYCKGRKPVTDFVVGQTYSAKVVYMKPFGVFFDIGCHSDAFCHVSRLSDDYVEAPEKMFKEGAEVPEVRVLEVDRKTKRITVSLQSLARQEDEKASMEARQHRRQKQRGGSKTPSSSSHKTRPSPESNPSPSLSSTHNKASSSFSHHTMDEETRPVRQKIIISAKDIRKEPVKPAVVDKPKPTMPVIINKPESEMTPAELKRARKIARRAERRAQQEQEGAAAQ